MVEPQVTNVNNVTIRVPGGRRYDLASLLFAFSKSISQDHVWFRRVLMKDFRNDWPNELVRFAGERISTPHGSTVSERSTFPSTFSWVPAMIEGRASSAGVLGHQDPRTVSFLVGG